MLVAKTYFLPCLVAVFCFAGLNGALAKTCKASAADSDGQRWNWDYTIDTNRSVEMPPGHPNEQFVLVFECDGLEQGRTAYLDIHDLSVLLGNRGVAVEGTFSVADGYMTDDKGNKVPHLVGPPVDGFTFEYPSGATDVWNVLEWKDLPIGKVTASQRLMLVVSAEASGDPGVFVRFSAAKLGDAYIQITDKAQAGPRVSEAQ